MTREQQRARQKLRRHVIQAGVPLRDADDVTQEVLFSIERSAAGFVAPPHQNRQDAWEAWCFGVVRKQVASYRRARSREAFELYADPAPASHGGAHTTETPEDQAIRRADLLLALQILARLQGPRRAVFVAYQVEGDSVALIASELEVPANTVWNLLRLARQQIRDELRRLASRQHHDDTARAAPPPARSFGGRRGRARVDDRSFEPLPDDEGAARE